MKKKIKSEQNIIIIIDAIKKIMTIFLGPFLTAYFISTSTNSILNIAIYYIFTYATMALSTLVVAALAEKRNRIKIWYKIFNRRIKTCERRVKRDKSRKERLCWIRAIKKRFRSQIKKWRYRTRKCERRNYKF